MRIRPMVCIVLAMATMLQGCPVVLVAGGLGAAAAAANDRRTSETLLADERLEWESSRRLRSSGQWESLNVNITSYNRMVLLTGQAANEDARGTAERIISEIPSVRGVINEMVVGRFSNFGQRSTDSVVTTQVKARFVTTDNFNPGHVKVVTEAGTVFLLGLVTQAEGDRAAQLAATTQGVGRVVKAFEYVSDPATLGTSK